MTEMKGTKRTSSGKPKPQPRPSELNADTIMTDPTPPCAQPILLSSKSTELQPTPPQNDPDFKRPKLTTTHPQPPLHASKAPTPTRKTHPKHTKLPKLPAHTTITTRPLLHPALAPPSSNASSPKILYITASTPHIPCVKRIRKFLAEISKREKQALGAAAGRYKARGSLQAKDVERGIVDGVRGKGKGGEKVYLKATGRAIPRALEIGVVLEGEGECLVRVEMGNVCAVDDVEVRSAVVGEGREGEEAVQEEEEIPETRLRTLSSVTVSIGLK